MAHSITSWKEETRGSFVMDRRQTKGQNGKYCQRAQENRGTVLEEKRQMSHCRSYTELDSLSTPGVLQRCPCDVEAGGAVCREGRG